MHIIRQKQSEINISFPHFPKNIWAYNFLEMDPIQHKYHFNNIGVVKDLVFPNKAIVHFKLNGKDEKAVLLSKVRF